MSRVVVVGGGVIGTMHALFARRGGHKVLHIERELDSRSASVRNFGLIWVSGRRPGPELALALRSREFWELLAAEIPGVGFRANGSLTIVQDERELRVLEEVVARSRQPAGAALCRRGHVAQPGRRRVPLAARPARSATTTNSTSRSVRRRA